MSDPVAPPPTAQPTQKKGPGCWTVGCGGCLVMLMILVGFGMYVNWQIQKFVVKPFEPIVLEEGETERMDAKLEEMRQLQSDAETSGESWIPAEGLTLSEQEVNYWLSEENPDFQDAIRFDFEPGEVLAELRVGDSRSDRRLQLSARLSVKQGPDGLDVRVVDAKLGNVSLPEGVLRKLTGKNVAQDAIDDPEVQEQLKESIGGVEVLKDAIRLLPPQN